LKRVCEKSLFSLFIPPKIRYAYAEIASINKSTHVGQVSLFGAFCPFVLGGRQMRLRPKEQKSLENPRLSDAKQFCRSRNARRQGKGRREYFVYSQGL
jgi:hypothetical protein